MATSFEIINDNNTAQYNFQTGALKPRDGTWRRKPARGGGFVETTTLVGHTTDANLISAVSTLQELVR